MPHAEMFYTADLKIDAAAMLREIEAIILKHDAGAGATKGRAYPAAEFNHTHMKVTVSLLPKPHRTAAFIAALQSDLVQAISGELPRPCWLSVDLLISGTGYHTEYLE